MIGNEKANHGWYENRSTVEGCRTTLARAILGFTIRLGSKFRRCRDVACRGFLEERFAGQLLSAELGRTIGITFLNKRLASGDTVIDAGIDLRLRIGDGRRDRLDTLVARPPRPKAGKDEAGSPKSNCV